MKSLCNISGKDILGKRDGELWLKKNGDILGLLLPSCDVLPTLGRDNDDLHLTCSLEGYSVLTHGLAQLGSWSASPQMFQP